MGQVTSLCRRCRTSPRWIPESVKKGSYTVYAYIQREPLTQSQGFATRFDGWWADIATALLPRQRCTTLQQELQRRRATKPSRLGNVDGHAVELVTTWPVLKETRHLFLQNWMRLHRAVHVARANHRHAQRTLEPSRRHFDPFTFYRIITTISFLVFCFISWSVSSPDPDTPVGPVHVWCRAADALIMMLLSQPEPAPAAAAVAEATLICTKPVQINENTTFISQSSSHNLHSNLCRKSPKMSKPEVRPM